jgi:uncharacterized protein YjbJ (UPF0337 family)
MLTLTPSEIETQNADALERFSKTAIAAQMSGTYHETAGFIKRNLGKLSDDSMLEDAGRHQQLIGKVHRLVGSLRSARNAFLHKLRGVRIETHALCREHGGRLVDGASAFVDEVKKVLLK